MSLLKSKIAKTRRLAHFFVSQEDKLETAEDPQIE